jgi:hypothetical protein
MAEVKPWCSHQTGNDVCEYVMKRGVLSCGEPMTHSVTYAGARHPLCAFHAQPKMHPPDIRKTLQQEGG